MVTHLCEGQPPSCYRCTDHAHIVALLDGKLQLGTWQQIVLIDFDTRPRSRQVIVQIVGE